MENVVVRVGSATETRVQLTQQEIDERAAIAANDTAARSAEAAYATDLGQRRAQLVADMQAIRDAATLAAVKAPLLRVLMFILRRLREQDS